MGGQRRAFAFDQVIMLCLRFQPLIAQNRRVRVLEVQPLQKRPFLEQRCLPLIDVTLIVMWRTFLIAKWRVR